MTLNNARYLPHSVQHPENSNRAHKSLLLLLYAAIINHDAKQKNAQVIQACYFFTA